MTTDSTLTYTVDFNSNVFDVVSRDHTVPVEIDQLGEGMLRELVHYGLMSRLASSANSAKAQVAEEHFGKKLSEIAKGDLSAWAATGDATKQIHAKTLELMEAAREELYKGEFSIRQSSGGGMDEVTALAHSMAKKTLMVTFKTIAKTVGSKSLKIADMVECHPKIAEYFRDGVWLEDMVADFIQRQADADKVDYMADAREELAKRSAAIEAVDVSELLGDI